MEHFDVRPIRDRIGAAVNKRRSWERAIIAAMKKLLMAMVLAAGLAPPVAADYAAGVAAYKQGDYAGALREVRPHAEEGDSYSQYGLAMLYKSGHGVEKDYGEAVKWFRKSAEQGNAKGQYGLANMYRTGRGVAKDHAQAVKWYRKAAEQGQINARHNLGLMYYFGYGVPKDIAEAYFWWTTTTGAGHARSIEWRAKAAEALKPERRAAIEARAKDWRPRPAVR